MDADRANWLWQVWLHKNLSLEYIDQGEDRQLVEAAIEYKLTRVGPPPAYLKPTFYRNEVTPQ